MSAHTADTVSVLPLSARIAESGSIAHLPETVRLAGAERSWEQVADARVNQEVAPLLAKIATAEPRPMRGLISSGGPVLTALARESRP